MALLSAADPFLLLAGLAMFPLGLGLSALKWRGLLRTQGISCGWGTLLKAYWVGFFSSNFLPTSTGGDAVRIALFRRSGNVAGVAASILAERATGVACLILWAGLDLVLVPSFPAEEGMRSLLVILGAAAGGAALLYGLRGALPRGIPGFQEGGGGWRGRGPEVLRSVFAALQTYRERPGRLLAALLWSVPFYLTPLLLHYVLFLAVGSPVSLRDVALVVPWVCLAGLLPLTPSGLGVTEGALVYLYAERGVAAPEAFAVALMARLLSIIASSPGGIWLLDGRLAAKGIKP